jgi:hypothetical protein
MAQRIQGHLRERMPEWKAVYPGVEEMHVAVMGCVVNGPGESKHADIGISLPGTFEEPKAPVFIDGALSTTLRGDALVDEFIAILDGYVGAATARPVDQIRSRSSAWPVPLTRERDSTTVVGTVQGSSRSFSTLVERPARVAGSSTPLTDRHVERPDRP